MGLFVCKNMKFKTIYSLTLLVFLMTVIQCGSKKPEMTSTTVEDAQKIIADRRAEQLKNADKLKKEAKKRNLKMQSKPVRKSIKKNAKMQKKRLKNIQYRKVGS